MVTTGQAQDLQAALVQAVALHRSGNLTEAERHYRAILSVEPDHFDALHLFGVCLYQEGKHSEACELIRQALKIQPESPAAHTNLGLTLQALGREHDALASYDKALAIKPDNPDVLANRSSALLALERPRDALASCERALAIDPNHVEALFNRASAAIAQNRPDEALASLDRALAIRPDYYKALNNRGNVLLALNRPADALGSFDRMLDIKPDDPEAHLNRAFACLTLGDYERGWAEYEWRRRIGDSGISRNLGKPAWLGREEIAGKSILLHAEQGLGDTIQFCRYAPFVSRLGAKVILEVQPPLKALLANLAGVDRVLARGEALPEFAYHSPLLSLPHALGDRMKAIPANVPYLSASVDRVSTWKERLGAKTAPRVGIAWSGRPENSNDRNRSLSLGVLAPLLSRGAQFVSLQNEARARDREFLDRHRDLVHFGAEIKDFADTAALASLMDLVIAVDTAVGHLAGALGKPLWALLPYSPGWRWPLDREDSPWYPSARQFRQTAPGDWNSVIQRIIVALDETFDNT